MMSQFEAANHCTLKYLINLTQLEMIFATLRNTWSNLRKPNGPHFERLNMPDNCVELNVENNFMNRSNYSCFFYYWLEQAQSKKQALRYLVTTFSQYRDLKGNEEDFGTLSYFKIKEEKLFPNFWNITNLSKTYLEGLTLTGGVSKYFWWMLIH